MEEIPARQKSILESGRVMHGRSRRTESVAVTAESKAEVTWRGKPEFRHRGRAMAGASGGKLTHFGARGARRHTI